MKKFYLLIGILLLISVVNGAMVEYSYFNASADKQYSSAYGAQKAFDNNTDTGWDSGSSALPHWLKQDYGNDTYGVNTTHIINRYLLLNVGDGTSPTAWTLYGSNNNSTWTSLDTQSGVSWSYPERKAWNFTNTNAYRYYMINFSAGQSNEIVIQEMNLWFVYSLPPPMVNFTSNVTSGYVPFDVQFNDTSIANILSWNWSFGTGALSTIQNPVYTYTDAGTYNVALNVSNSSGVNITTKSGYIIAYTPTPTPTPTATSTGITTNIIYCNTSSIDFKANSITENSFKLSWNTSINGSITLYKNNDIYLSGYSLNSTALSELNGNTLYQMLLLNGTCAYKLDVTTLKSDSQNISAYLYSYLPVFISIILTVIALVFRSKIIMAIPTIIMCYKLVSSVSDSEPYTTLILFAFIFFMNIIFLLAV